MSEMSMIERLVRAMNGDPANAEHRDTARAAIEAMREPTDAMFDAAKPFGICMSALDDAYRAMIDAALSEVEG